jgi:hypothetical protein
MRVGLDKFPDSEAIRGFLRRDANVLAHEFPFLLNRFRRGKRRRVQAVSIFTVGRYTALPFISSSPSQREDTSVHGDVIPNAMQKKLHVPGGSIDFLAERRIDPKM